MKKLLTVFVIALVLTLAIASVAMAIDVPENKVVAWGELDSITKIAGHNIDTDQSKWICIRKESCAGEGTLGIYHVPCLDEVGKYHVIFVKKDHRWSSTVDGMQWGNVIEKPTCTHTGLAIDVCVDCHEVDENHTRVIDMLPHVYNAATKDASPEWKLYPDGWFWWAGYFVTAPAEPDSVNSYVVVTAPTCAQEGDCYRKCLECGGVDTTTKVSLQKVPHTWTEWSPIKAPNCLNEGYATRACIVCGGTESLTQALVDQYWGYPYWYATADECREMQIAFNTLVRVTNPNWDNTMTPILNAQFGGSPACEWERYRPEDWLTTCYTHDDVYICPYCHCDPIWCGYPTPHKKVKDTDMPTTAHEWKKTPEEIGDPGIDTTGLWDKDKDKARLDWAWNNAKSVAATCLYDGFDLYKCIYDDGVADASWPVRHDENDPHRYNVIRVPALGHDWSKWELVQTFTLKGQTVYQYVRTCKRCGMNEEKVTYDEGGEEKVQVSSITIKSKLTLKVGKTKNLTAKVKPAVASNKNVVWTTSDKKVATVSKTGKVKAKGKGTCIITCTAADGSGVQAFCKVTVK